MPASGRLAPAGIAGRSALAACRQLAGARLWCQRRSILTLPAAQHYRRCMSDGSNYLDPNRPDAVRLSVSDASALGEAALGRIGYGGDDGRIITDQLIDNALCGYRFAGLPRILAIAREARPGTPAFPLMSYAKRPFPPSSTVATMSAMSRSIAAPKSRLPKRNRAGSPRSASTTAISAGAYYLERIVDAGLCRSSHRQRLAAHRTARRNPPGSGHQPDRLRLSVGRRARHFRHRHGIADVG